MLCKTVPSINCKRQSENGTDSRHASIAAGCPPVPLKRVGDLPSQPARGRPHKPLASLAEEDDNKMCLPAKRQPISTLGIGTVNAPFSTLQVKLRRHLAPQSHFDEQSSACLREKLRIEKWCQNVKSQKSATSIFQKCACNSAAARKTNGVTSCFGTDKRVVLKLLLRLKHGALNEGVVI